MSHEILVEFLGFEAKETVREYTFQVRDTPHEPREFTLTIDLDAFTTRLLRFQDAPDVCSSRLRRELVANANHPSETHFHITHAELDDYRSRHTPPKRSMFHRPRDEEY
jgi:hypothetical protein